MIHDKFDESMWACTVQDWEEEFDHDDVVISQDPQRTLGNDTFAVYRIDLFTEKEHVQRLGLFWTHGSANVFAHAIHEELRGWS